MKYKVFEELPVWQAAIEFALKLFEFTSQADFRGLGDTKNQLERAAVSISNNIAEGFERGSSNELIAFLFIAKGSAGECRSMLRLCERSERFLNLRSEILSLIDRSTNISKQLKGWLDSAINSDIRGVKFLTEKERMKYQQKKEDAGFDQQMEQWRRDFQKKLEDGTLHRDPND